MDVPLLPTINASLNALASVLLFAGWIAQRKREYKWHGIIMTAALITSAVFLACYLYYHFTQAGITRYQGVGFMRYLYFTILITHTPLATLMTPFILAAVYFAARRNFKAHTRITRRLWPVWMYVSVTGVIIYIILYILPQPGA